MPGGAIILLNRVGFKEKRSRSASETQNLNFAAAASFQNGKIEAVDYINGLERTHPLFLSNEVPELHLALKADPKHELSHSSGPRHAEARAEPSQIFLYRYMLAPTACDKCEI